VLDTTDGSALWLGAAGLLSVAAVALLGSRADDRLKPVPAVEVSLPRPLVGP
jgi:hypothetical protein